MRSAYCSSVDQPDLSHRPVRKHRSPEDVGLGQAPPVATVVGTISMVAHYKIRFRRHVHFGEVREVFETDRHVRLAQMLAVDVHRAAPDCHPIPGSPMIRLMKLWLGSLG